MGGREGGGRVGIGGGGQAAEVTEVPEPARRRWAGGSAAGGAAGGGGGSRSGSGAAPREGGPMELENIVANTVLLKAREGEGMPRAAAAAAEEPGRAAERPSPCHSAGSG